MPKENTALSAQDRSNIVHWAKIGLSVAEICKRLPGLTAERCRSIANKAGFWFPTQRSARRALAPGAANSAPEAGAEEVSNESLAHLEAGTDDPTPTKQRLSVLEAPRPHSVFAATEHIKRLERAIEKIKDEKKELEAIIVDQARQICRGSRD